MRRGFTLFELVVTLAVMTVVLTMTLPSLRLPDEPSPLEAALGETTQLLTSARRTAIRGGHPVTLTIDTHSGRYWIRRGHESPLTTARLELPSGVGLQSRGPRIHMHFRPDGTTAADSLAIAGGGRVVGLVLSPWTGDVRAVR